MAYTSYLTYSRSAVPNEICIPFERHVNDNEWENDGVEAWFDFSSNDTLGNSDSDSSNSLRLHQIAAPSNAPERNNEIGQVGKEVDQLKPIPANGNPLGENWVPFHTAPRHEAFAHSPGRKNETGPEEKLKPTPANGKPSGETWVSFPAPQRFAWETNNIRRPVIQPSGVGTTVGHMRDTESKCVANPFDTVRVHVVTSTINIPRGSTAELNVDQRACPHRSVHPEGDAGATPEMPWYCDQQQGKRWWVPGGASYPGFPIHSKLEAMHHQVSKPVKATLSAMRTASEPVMASLLAAKTILMGPIQLCMNGGQDPGSDDERSDSMAIPEESNAELRRRSITSSSWNSERRDQLDSPMFSQNEPESIMHALHAISECPHDTELFLDEIPEDSVSDCRRELRDGCSNGNNLDVFSIMLERDDRVSAGMWSELRDRGDRGFQSTRLNKWGPKFDEPLNHVGWVPKWDEGVQASQQLGPKTVSSSALGTHIVSPYGSNRDSVDTRRGSF
jgi:hypothetical protein